MAGVNVKNGGGILSGINAHVALALAAILLSGCITPSDGPRGGTYNNAATERVTGSKPDGSRERLPFVLVDLDQGSANILEDKERDDYFRGSFKDRRGAADIRIGYGDVIRVTIFEAGSGGLFVPTSGTVNSGNFVAIPDQEVDRSGSISVPYAAANNDGGVIKVQGRRPIEVQADIEKRLADRALEPQVVVTIVNRTSNLYSVLGDVNAPGRFNVTQSGLRVLDAIGAAGGPKEADYNTLVTIQRGSQTATARLTTLINEPENNIYVRPNDIISIKKDERFYNIYGAVGSAERVAFESEKITLADAIARAGGLSDERADPQAVMVYRRENPDTVRAIGASLNEFNTYKGVPTVYRLDLTQPDGFFLAQKMPLRDSDMVYVSNHPFTEVSKVLSVVRDVLLIRLIDD